MFVYTCTHLIYGYNDISRKLAELGLSLVLLCSSVKVLKTTDRVTYHRMGGGWGGGVDCDSFTAKHRFGEGGGGGGGGVDCDSFTRIEVWRRGGGGEWGSNVTVSARGFVGIA